MNHSDPITLAEREAARTATRLTIVGAVGKLFEAMSAESRLNQSRLAERLGVSRARVSRLLSGPGNWTLDTVGDLLAAMESRITRVDILPIDGIPARNHVHPWLIETEQSQASAANTVTLQPVSPALAPAIPATAPTPQFRRK